MAVQADGTEVPFNHFAWLVTECVTQDYDDGSGIIEHKVRMWRGKCICGVEKFWPMEMMKAEMDCGCRVSDTKKFYAMGERGPGRPKKARTEEDLRALLEPRRPGIRLGQIRTSEAKRQVGFNLPVGLIEPLAKWAHWEGKSASGWVEAVIRERIEKLEELYGNGDDGAGE